MHGVFRRNGPRGRTAECTLRLMYAAAGQSPEVVDALLHSDAARYRFAESLSTRTHLIS